MNKTVCYYIIDRQTNDPTENPKIDLSIYGNLILDDDSISNKW